MAGSESLAFAQTALSLLAQKPALATPDNLRHLFRFLAEASDRQINLVAHAFAQGGLSDALVEQMIQAVAPAHVHSEILDSVGADLEGQISHALSLISTAHHSTNDYGETLKSADRVLENISDKSDIASLVSTLMTATLSMERTTQSLEAELAASGKQIELLNSRLADLRNQANIDPLTEIANRRYFDEAMAKEMRAAAELSDDLCVCVGDIDHFKKFNDTHGHQTGDQVLRLVASTISNCARDSDVVARYGGEEFAVLLPHTTIEMAVAVANRIRTSLSAKPLVKRSSNKQLGNVTISIGVARYHHGESADDLMCRADKHLYEAKHKGRDLVVCEPPVDPNVTDGLPLRKVAQGVR